MTAAALVSTGFFAAPVVLDRSHATPPPSAETPARVELVATDVVATVTTPQLRLPAARVVRTVNATQPPARARRTSGKLPQNPFPRMFARLIAGDGRYAVRPFPTVEPVER
jgi:hypothetical protein